MSISGDVPKEWHSNFQEVLQRRKLNKFADDVDILAKGIVFEATPEKSKLNDSLLIDQINSSKITQLKLLKEGRPEKEPHDKNVIQELCSCENCLKYRTSVVTLYLEEYEYNILWLRLQKIVKKTYNFIPDDEESPLDRKYKELMCRQRTKWLTDGQLDFKRNIQISLASNLPLNNELTLFLIFNVLYSRDPHQLFELLCIQVKAMLKAYCVKLKDIFKPKTSGDGLQFNLVELTMFLYDGLHEIQNGAFKLGPLIDDHLKQFNLTWLALNSQMFHRWVSTEVLLLMRLNPGQYCEIFFDGEFTESFLKWSKSWRLLEKYHSSKKDKDRRNRILAANHLLNSIKTSGNVAQTMWNKGESTKENYWHGILVHIRTIWQPCKESRIMAPHDCNKCIKCGMPIYDASHAWNCGCRTCMIAGGLFPFWSLWELERNYQCPTCYFKGFFDAASKIAQSDVIYHLSWAVFKHLPDRVPYMVSEVDLKHFCVFRHKACVRIECFVALSVIIGHYPKEMAEFLVKKYKPLSEVLRKRLTTHTNPSNLFVILSEEKLLDVDTVLAAISENHYRKQAIPDLQNLASRFLKDSFKKNGKDIDVDLSACPQWNHKLDLRNNVDFPCGFVEKILLKIDPFYGKTMNEENGYEAVIRNKNSQLGMIQLLERTINDFKNFVKKCQFFLEDENNVDMTIAKRSAKEKPPEKTEKKEPTPEPIEDYCSLFGHAECCHTRGHETRDRLRKRLQQMSEKKESSKTRVIEKVESKLNGKSSSSKSEAMLFYNQFESFLKRMPATEQFNLKEVLSNLNYPDTSLTPPPPPPPSPPLPDCSDCCSHGDDGEDLEAFQQSLDIDTIVQYIEGNDAKFNGDFNSKDQNKKALKKAKQKQKKLEQKKLLELGELKKTYHEQCAAENDLKAELKVLKGAKKKDKKKIQELEVEVKKASRLGSKTESVICGIICEIREFNPEFKFSYQPPKDVPKPKVEKQAQQPLKSTIIPSPALVNGGNTNTFSQFVAMQRQGIQTPLMPQIPNQMMVQMQAIDDSETDPSRRMISIGRINNAPHAEPQVIVSVKGKSPDRDRLLYSFINGQMVPAMDLDPGAVKKFHQTLFHSNSKYQEAVTVPNKPDSPVNNKNEKEKVTNKKVEGKKKGKEKEKEKESNKINAKKTELNSKQKVDNVKLEKPEKEKVKPTKEKTKTVESKKPTKEVKKQEPVKVEPVVKKKDKNQENKPLKYEYIDPEFQLNKFGCLSINDDDDEEPLSEEEFKPVKVSNKKQSKEKQNQISVSKTEKKEPKTPVPMGKKEKKNKVEAPKPPQQEILPPEVPLTKKQLKKLAQKERKLNGQTTDPISKAVKSAEKMAESLSSSMKKLHLNADTAIELINRRGSDYRFDPNSANNVSIMDRLNRGIKVEGLQLPPGITLTRVDPTRAEQIQRKRDSIERIAIPQTQVPQEQNRPHLIMANPCMDVLNIPGNPEQNQVIMVEAPVLNKNNSNKDQNAKSNNNNNKKNKKENKNQKVNQGQAKPPQNIKEKILNQQNKKGKNSKAPSKPDSKIVTLRNPLFHDVASDFQRQPQPQNPTRLRTSTGTIDTPASITQNDNGMYTIRNPAFNTGAMGSLGGLGGSNLGPYVPSMYNPNSTPQMNGFPSTPEPKKNPTKAAIGSEMKRGQKQMPWQPHLPNQYNGYQPTIDDQNRSYSPFNSQINLPTNYANFGSQNNSNGGGFYQNNGFSAYVSADQHCGGHNDASGHQCEDPHPSTLVNNQKYFREPSYPPVKMDDMAFLQNLQPGQRLNSEVTIHNINESKFLQNQHEAPISNHVEITRIPISRTSNCDNLAVGSQRPSRSSAMKQNEVGKSGVGNSVPLDQVFAPNQQVNLNELESDERDIESFKRFNYFFEPPKNKPKVNLNVQDIYGRSSPKPMNGERGSPSIDLGSISSFN